MTLALMRHVVSCTFNSITVFLSSVLTCASQKTEFQNRKKNRVIGAIPCLLHEMLCTQRKYFCTLAQSELWHGESMSIWTVLVMLWSYITCPRERTKSLSPHADKDWQGLQENKESCVMAKDLDFFSLKNVHYYFFLPTFIYLIFLICKIEITILCI